MDNTRSNESLDVENDPFQAARPTSVKHTKLNPQEPPSSGGEEQEMLVGAPAIKRALVRLGMQPTVNVYHLASKAKARNADPRDRWPIHKYAGNWIASPRMLRLHARKIAGGG